MRAALGLIVGLGCGYLAGWAIHESAFVHALIGAGVALWLGGALALAVAAVVAFALGRWWR